MARPRLGLNYESDLRDTIARLGREHCLDFVELVVDDYLETPERLRALLDGFGLPYAFHFVGMSLGTVGVDNGAMYAAMRGALRAFSPIHFSDHLTFSRQGSIDLGQNLGVPRTPAMVDVFVANIAAMKRAVGARVPFLVENIAALWEFDADELTPGELYREVLVRSDSHALLDLHNLYADEVNFGRDARAFIDTIPLERVRELHVAGGGYADGARTTYVDTHRGRIPPRVFELVGYVLARCSPAAIVLERPRRGEAARRHAREVELDLQILHELAAA